MLSKKVIAICHKHGYTKCDECPLQVVCEMDHIKMPGATTKEKTDLWEQLMNITAEVVKDE